MYYLFSNSLQQANIQIFPNYTALPEANDTYCESKMKSGSSSTSLPSLVINLVTIIIVSVLTS